MQPQRKILLKVFDNRNCERLIDGDIKYMHFCRVDKDLTDRFYKQTGVTAAEVVRVFEKWAIADFGITLKDTGMVAIRQFKSELENALYAKYGGSLLEGIVLQKLISTWVTTHMKEELENGQI